MVLVITDILRECTTFQSNISDNEWSIIKSVQLHIAVRADIITEDLPILLHATVCVSSGDHSVPCSSERSAECVAPPVL